jgi:tripartite-type tricarboxylate transporter receptor subunit TctC
MVTDLLAGRIQMTVSTIPSVMSYIQSGALRALGVGDEEPLPQLPNVPPISKSGVPGYVVTGWNALMAPGRTGASVIERLTTTLQQTVADPGVADALTRSGAVPAYSGPAQMAAFLREEVRRWGEVIRARNIELT